MPVNHLFFIILLHAAFGGAFLFLYAQHSTKFSRLLGQAWLLEACRAAILLPEIHGLGDELYHHWFTLSDLLNLLATWWLLAGCADLAGVKLPRWLSRVWFGAGLPLILLLRYPLPALVADWTGLPLDVAVHRTLFAEQLLVFLPLMSDRARNLAIAAYVVLVLAIGLSRLMLGVHFISDVLGGYVLGAAWLAASVAAFEIWREERGKRHTHLADEGVEPEEARELVA